MKTDNTQAVKGEHATKRPGPATAAELHPSVTALLTLRHQRGITQIDMARTLGVSQRTLQDWERGRRRPKGPSQALLDRVTATLKREPESRRGG